MAAHAVRGIQSVIVIGVALRARGRGVCPSQSKAGRAVVKIGPAPTQGGVAGSTVGNGKSGS